MSDTGLFADESTAPYAPFRIVGTEYSGIIIRASKMQAIDYVPKAQRDAGRKGEPLWWEKPSAANPAGRPKWVVIVTLQTDLRDPNIPDDDGRRSLWIKGKQMETAVKKGLREAGASAVGIVEGGWFRMKFTHETPTDGENVSATKHYEVTYRPPQSGANTDDPWANVPTQQDPWAVDPSSQPAPDNSAGLPPAVMEQLTPEARQALARLTQGGNR